LLILGDSKKSTSRDELLQLAGELGVADDVDLPGFVTNPLAYMARASVFALSSAWEGLPGVLIEAMACGCPVVSTDCPGGSREILNDGRVGPLVPVGDADALAKAICALIDAPTPRDVLLARAADFDVDRAVESYLQLFANTVARRRGDGPSA
jgi:glycosyltransferase involved in cell wall biosynthesis